MVNLGRDESLPNVLVVHIEICFVMSMQHTILRIFFTNVTLKSGLYYTKKNSFNKCHIKICLVMSMQHTILKKILLTNVTLKFVLS